MCNHKQQGPDLIFAYTKQEKGIALLGKQHARKNYAIGFTFQTTSKDFITSPPKSL